MQESRLFGILYHLLQTGRATAPELAEQLEVSVRTIYRDIDALSSAGIPIAAERGRGSGITLPERYTLDRALLSPQEQEQLLTAVQGFLAAGQEDASLLPAKLAGLFRTQNAPWVEMDLTGWVQNRPEPGLLRSLREAVLQKRVVSFRYFGGSCPGSLRHVEPVRLVFKDKGWYLYGFCLLRESYRFFKLTRMAGLLVLDETHTRRLEGSALARSPLPERTVPVTLRFSPALAFRVYDEFPGAAVEDEAGFLCVTAELPDSEALYSYLFSFGSQAEVLAPSSVREEMARRTEALYEKYKT